PMALLAVFIAWRIGQVVDRGRAQHVKEVAARVVVATILRAEQERRIHPPGARDLPKHAYLSELIAENRIGDLVPVPDPRLEIYRSGDYLFHVSLLTRLNSPRRVPPAEGNVEAQFGDRFEVWAWPAD